MKAVTFLLSCFVFLTAKAQYPSDTKRDNVWLFGYQNGYPWGLSVVNFSTGTPVSSYDSTAINFYNTEAAISDTAGNLICYTNGNKVANRLNQVVPNGDSIGCCYAFFDQDVLLGSSSPRGAMILPYPGHPDWYAVLTRSGHMFPAPVYGGLGALQFSLFDVSLDSGLGDIVFKNQVLLPDTLATGNVNACRHANGRDWWLLQHKWGTSDFYIILFDPTGFHIVDTAHVNIFLPSLYGQDFFTPDGRRYVVGGINDFDSDSSYLYSFDFDRCSGTLSNPRRAVVMTPSGTAAYSAASPNSQFAYLGFADGVYQFDLNSVNLEGSQIQVAQYDGFADTVGVTALPTIFQWMQLGPDGKIYITAGSTRYLHVIETPDLPGISCNVQQHIIYLPSINGHTMPNFPNFRLGPVDGSSCDSLGIDVITSDNTLATTSASILVYPNPTTNAFQLNATRITTTAAVEILNPLGQTVYRCKLSPQNGFIRQGIDASNWPSGIYLVSLQTVNRRVTQHIVVQH